MSTLAIARPQQNLSFPEDSLGLKALSAIPLLGFLPRLFTAPTLHQKLDRAINREPVINNDKVIKLIKIKNDYLTADVIRDVLTVALLVAGVAFGILVGSAFEAALIGASIGLYTVSSCVNFARLMYNQEVIEEIKESGVRPGLKIR